MVRLFVIFVFLAMAASGSFATEGDSLIIEYAQVSEIDIVNGEGVALNYSGSAPDIGAHEYGSSVAPPVLLKLVSGN